MNVELYLALGTTIAAIVVPYFVNKNNNEHQRVMKKMDLVFTEKYKAYSNFCTAYSVAASDPTPEKISAFKAAVNQAYLLHAKGDLRQLGLSCACHLAANDPKAEDDFLECTKAFSYELDDMILDFDFFIPKT